MAHWRDQLRGGKADRLTPAMFPKRLLIDGMHHELEHTKSHRLAMEIAMDHLAEDLDYYQKLKNVEGNPSTSRRQQRFKRGEHVEATHTDSRGSQQRQQSSSGSTRRKEQEEAYRQWYQELKQRKEAYRQWYQEWKQRKEEEFTRRWSGGRTREQEDEARRKRKADSRSARTAARREARKAWVKPPYDAQIKWTYAHWVGQYDRFPPRGFGGKMGWQRYEAAVKVNATTVRDAYHAGVKWRDLRRWETGRYIVLERG